MAVCVVRARHCGPLFRVKGTEHVRPCTQVAIQGGIVDAATHDLRSENDFLEVSALRGKI